MPGEFRARYGPWAIVAGASGGLGAAFADALAERGLNILLLARRRALLEGVAERLRAKGVEARAETLDLGAPGLPERLTALAGELEIGLGVYNAAFTPVGALVDQTPEDLERVVDVGVRGPLAFARALAPGMVARGRGGLILMSSLAGLQGSPRIAAYAGAKAFNIVLGESLWAELKPRGVDVLVTAAGAIRTPGYALAASKEAPGTLDARDVAEPTLDAFGKGPIVSPGLTNKLARFVMGRLLPRRTQIAIMGRSTAGLT